MIDLYTKCILTIIAIALCSLAVQGYVEPSRAQAGDIQKVRICDTEHCATLQEMPDFDLSKKAWGLGVVLGRGS